MGNGAGRLKHLRYLDGLTIREAADAFGVPVHVYTAIERGVSTQQLDASRIGYSPERLASVIGMSEPAHRERISIPVETQRSNREQLRLAAELTRELRQQVATAPSIAVEPFGVPSPAFDVEEMAEDCRHILGVSSDEPIRDLTGAIEQAGISVTPFNVVGVSRKAVVGLSAWVEGQPVIGISLAASGGCFRLALCHELGHLLMHPHHSYPAAENEASDFAADLLLPADQLAAAVGSKPTLDTFADVEREWGIPIRAAIRRAHVLGILDLERFRPLQVQASGWSEAEPSSFKAGPGRLLPQLVEAFGGVRSVSLGLGIAGRHVAMTIDWESHARCLKLVDGSGVDRSNPIRPDLQVV